MWAINTPEHSRKSGHHLGLFHGMHGCSNNINGVSYDLSNTLDQMMWYFIDNIFFVSINCLSLEIWMIFQVIFMLIVMIIVEVSLVKLTSGDYQWTSLRSLIQFMAYCCQARSHYLNWYWPNSVLPCDVTGQRWVNTLRPGQNGRHFLIFKCIFFNLSMCFA